MNQFRHGINGDWDILTKEISECPICNLKLKKLFSEGDIYVFENDLNVSPSKFQIKKDLYEYSNPHGWEEVVAFKEHNTSFGMLSTSKISKMLSIIKNRYSHLSLGESVKSILVYYDTRNHFSFNIVALPFIPSKMKEEEKHSDFFDKIIKSNMVIYSNENVAIAVNPVPSTNYELIIVPKRRVRDITELRDDEIFSISESLKICHKIFEMIGIKEYEVLLFNSPIKGNLYFHIYFKNIGVHKTIEGYGINMITKAPEKLVGEING